jgi:ATP-dependent exoDNAse (exonuclease V) beta subunit
MPDSRTVAPGFHAFDGYSVLWCDPRWFTLGLKPSYGVRRQELIVKEAPREVIEEGRRTYDGWRSTRDSALRTGSIRSLSVQTIRCWAADLRPDTPPDLAPGLVATVNIERPAGADSRPAGAMFGRLVHAVLAQAPFDADAALLGDLAAAEGRVMGATADSIAAAARVAGDVLSHDLLVRARTAAGHGMCRREAPVILSLADGSLLEGVVDLAFEENGAWTVIDYKTDRELAAAADDRHRRQVALYASAVSRATGQPASGVLIRI